MKDAEVKVGDFVFPGRTRNKPLSKKAEQAYRRSNALEKRRKLMEAWAQYCEPKRVGTSCRCVNKHGAKTSRASLAYARRMFYFELANFIV